MDKLTIAIDFDDTYTADVDLWNDFIQIAQQKGHTVICVTARDGTMGDEVELESALPLGVDIEYCYCEPKLEVMERRGMQVDIWIDDNPGNIIHKIKATKPGG